MWPVHEHRNINRLAEDKLSYPVGRIIILSEDSLDISVTGLLNGLLILCGL